MIWLALGLLLAVLLLQLWLVLRPRSGGVDAGLAQPLQALQQAAQQTQLALAKSDGALEHMTQQLLGLSHHLNQHQQAASDSLRKLVEGRMAQSLAEARASRQELQQHFQQLQEALAQQLHRLQQGNLHSAEQLRGTLNERLAAIQTDNADKLEAMRRTVDEKLHETLEQRLGESFKLVSDRLEQVHKGLGEMQTLAGSVGDLKRVMTNVKTRGTWGEVQLGAIIDNVLTPAQYAKNVKTLPGSDELVEFAIRLPGQGGVDDAPVWLPIDAKYPVEHYQRLQDALDAGERAQVAAAGNAFESSIRAEAKKIAAKYLAPPHTTDFAVMYLPSESLFAEVLRRPGLVEALQNDSRVVVTGPANLAAMLSSLQMGFKTLAIEQRSSEVWAVLGQVKTEFAKFGEVVEATRKSIDAAARRFEQVDVRTRAIQRRLRGVQELPAPGADALGAAMAVAALPPGEAPAQPGGAGLDDEDVNA
ncbi:DNA recombination protein RmuC [Comamonas sp. GB3 AK4-5]|uniref:DNA recombination protein RmuC n=1 Tax=Comamonas sp. GB3 AK4-5 TaxID=3231487 RepID=UPI00351F1B7B